MKKILLVTASICVIAVLAVFTVKIIPSKDTLAGEIKGYETGFFEWSKIWETGIKNFSPEAMKLVKEEPIQPDYENMIKDFKPEDFALQQRFLFRCSPDGSFCLDIFLEGGLFEENGKVEFECCEPDSGVAMLNMKTGKFSRLLYCGTSCGYQTAVWLGDSKFAVLGSYREYISNNKDRIKAVAFVFDLEKSLKRTYCGPKIGGKKSVDLIREKLYKLKYAGLPEF